MWAMGKEEHQFHQERGSIKNVHFFMRGAESMAAHKWNCGACRGDPRGENGMGKRGFEPHEERMNVCVCVCVCVRDLCSKLPLKVEKELYSQMNTLPSFYSK